MMYRSTEGAENLLGTSNTDFESYKLDNVAFHFTGERKDDITPK